MISEQKVRIIKGRNGIRYNIPACRNLSFMNSRMRKGYPACGIKPLRLIELVVSKAACGYKPHNLTP